MCTVSMYMAQADKLIKAHTLSYTDITALICYTCVISHANRRRAQKLNACSDAQHVYA